MAERHPRVVALVAPLAVCGLLYLVRERVAAASALLVLVLCIVVVAATGDRLAGVVAARPARRALTPMAGAAAPRATSVRQRA